MFYTNCSICRVLPVFVYVMASSPRVSQVPTSTTELSTMLLPRPASTQGSERRGRALSAASYLTDAMEGEEQRQRSFAGGTVRLIVQILVRIIAQILNTCDSSASSM